MLAVRLGTFREPPQTNEHVDFGSAQRDWVKRNTGTLAGLVTSLPLAMVRAPGILVEHGIKIY